MKLRIEQWLRQCRFLALALVVAATGGLALAPSQAQAQVTAPATGTIGGKTALQSATFTLQRFETQVVNGVTKLVAIGTVNGTYKSSNGLRTFSVGDVAAVLPNPPQASCPVLNLVLGPLDLNVLGLAVHLDQVVLDITAIPGPGNLLGNLLCSVANLLNTSGSGNLQLVAALLNQILGLL